MKKVVLFIITVVFLYSCSESTKEVKVSDEKNVQIEVVDTVVSIEEVKDIVEVKEDFVYKEGEGIVFTEATVLSVNEELIMPSDYLTTVMTVITDNNDTLVFFDINQEDVRAGERISLNYEIKKESRLLICMDCNEYSGKVGLIDVTALPGDITFESLQFVKYNEDEYIIPASTFSMMKENGEMENFQSTDFDMVNDTVSMLDGYHTYGIIIKLYPELVTFEQVRY